MSKNLEGVYSALALAESDRPQVAVLPIGTFDTAKYGELTITAEMAAEIVANWEAKVLKTDIRFDIGHVMEEAAGWIVGLSVGTFEHPVSGETLPGIIAEVDWTPVGEKLLGEKQYRYVSSYLSNYKDEETGTLYKNVLMAVALCNDPVMRMLPPVELADVFKATADSIVLGEVVDGMQAPYQTADPTIERAADGYWPAVSSFDRLVREAITSGLTGDDLRSRIAELTADLPEAIERAVATAVETENIHEVAEAEADAAGVPEVQVDPFQAAAPAAQLADTGDDPVAEWLARFDALMGDADAIVGGTAGVRTARTLAAEARKKLAALLSKKGGSTKMSDTDKKLTDEPTPEAIELAELKRGIRNGKIDTALKALSDKGMTEPARDALEAILKSDTPDAIILSEGAEAVDMPDALMAFAAAVEFVPVDPDLGKEVTPPVDEVELSEAEIKFGTSLGLTIEDLKAAKATAQKKED